MKKSWATQMKVKMMGMGKVLLSLNERQVSALAEIMPETSVQVARNFSSFLLAPLLSIGEVG
jgi:hypothetical protein